MPVARRAVDLHTGVGEPVARRVNIVDQDGEMAKVAPAALAGLAPIMGQLDFGLVARKAEEDQGELGRRHIAPPPLFEPQQLKKCNSGVRIGHAEHGMEKFH